MKVGLYFDLRIPDGLPDSAQRRYAFTLELIEEVEHLGGDSVWFSEHHLFDDGYLPQPLTFAAAVAARTSGVRIGTAVVVAPLHNPVEIAEQAALVDLISGGRIEIGLGAGYRVPEYELYGVSAARRFAKTSAYAQELRRLWSPEGGVTPRPVQARVPLWMGFGGEQGARRAGLSGEFLMTADGARWPHYRDGLLAGGHSVTGARMGGPIQGYVSEDPERDWPLIKDHVSYMMDSYRRYLVEGTGRPMPGPVDPDKLRRREPAGILDYFLFGEPKHVAEKIRAYAGASPVDTVYMWASIADMGEAQTVEHVRTICGKLAPLLQDDY